MSYKIKKAVISLSDKSEIKLVLNTLKKFKVNVISSGGTSKEIKKLGYKCTDVSEYTNSDEILDGRVKTLHPKLYAGILNKRDNVNHKKELKKNNYDEIDLVIVNFYPFEETLKSTKNHNKLIENIDIGGPTLVRAAAKNYKYTTVLTSPHQYKEFILDLEKNKGSTSLELRKKLSQEAFNLTAYYDSVISEYLNNTNNDHFPQKKTIHGNLVEVLRYGENPHQQAAIYSKNNNLGQNKKNIHRPTENLFLPPRFEISGDINMIRTSRLVGIQTKGYDSENFDKTADATWNTDEHGNKRYLNIIRWRYKKNKDGTIAMDEKGNKVTESNARIISWSDGTKSIQIGNELLDIDVKPLPQHQHWVYKQVMNKPPDAEADTVLECAGDYVKSRWSVKPSSVNSKSHKELVRLQQKSRAKKKSKQDLIKRTVTITDPEKDDEITDLERLTGTAMYMPPEVALAAKFSSRSDVWSVGVTLFLMIAGHLPYETHEDKKTPLFETLTNKSDPVLQSLRPTHKELLSSMLQIDSASRCSATEAILQLNAILDDLNWMKLKTDENPSNFDRVASTKPNQNTNQNM